MTTPHPASQSSPPHPPSGYPRDLWPDDLLKPLHTQRRPFSRLHQLLNIEWDMHHDRHDANANMRSVQELQRLGVTVANSDSAMSVIDRHTAWQKLGGSPSLLRRMDMPTGEWLVGTDTPFPRSVEAAHLWHDIGRPNIEACRALLAWWREVLPENVDPLPT